MDCDSNWDYKTLINELTQGMELAKQLRFHLSSTSAEAQEFLLLQRIISSYEKALLILKWSGGSSGTALEELNKNCRDQQEISKKRKTLPIWTEQVKVSSDSGLEGPSDDVYSWRKYGQKDILGAKYPRSYYRCTYRHIQNCWATKQVQRSDEDATVFEITYRGAHTCNLATTNSPEKNVRANLGVNNTGDSENKYTVSPFSFPSTYIEGENQYFPSSTSESNYFPLSCHMMNNLGVAQNLQHSDSDLTDLISATNSPVGGLDFSIDPAELDANFNFTRAGFFQ